MIKDKLRIRGDVDIVVYDPLTGRIKDKREIRNLVVDAGLALLASRLASNAANFLSHLAIGTDATGQLAADVALGGELARVALGSSAPAGNVLTVVGNFPAGIGTGVLREAGLFNAGAGGTMAARTTFPILTKEAADGVSITWVLTFEAAE